MGKPLIIRDEIHGDMSFGSLLQNVIDHEYFQRLRSIKQLGLADYVFPCATHTRYQHSLGAAYLASQYFENLLHNWLSFPIHFESAPENVEFHCSRTSDIVKAVDSHESSREYWSDLICLAALLHDVGHGPWSHTFEHLNLKQDFSGPVSRIEGPVGEYLGSLIDSGKQLCHEEISLIYIHQIFRDLEEQGNLAHYRKYFLPVSCLVNRKLPRGAMAPRIQQELDGIFSEFQIEGGSHFHKLLRPLISGPFDVDRIDYIQRDGRNCGVQTGAIEWLRIVGKLMPCLASYRGEDGEPNDVVLLSSIKNQHVLDDFVFRLFQMYTQVYLHPKIVGLEEVIRTALYANAKLRKDFVVTMDRHCTLTDENLRDICSRQYGVKAIDEVLLRRRKNNFLVITHPTNAQLDESLESAGFRLVEGFDRAMLKDTMGVFLYSSIRGLVSHRNQEPNFYVYSWTAVSPIARQFASINYSPSFWLKETSEPWQ